MYCGDLVMYVDGVMRAVDLLSLLSEARANRNVQCPLGRLSPSRKKQFRHDVIRLIHQGRTFRSRVGALRCRATNSAFFAAPEGRLDRHQDLAACHQPHMQAHTERRATNQVLCAPRPTLLRRVQAHGHGSVLPSSIACTSVSRTVSDAHVHSEPQSDVYTTHSDLFSS